MKKTQMLPLAAIISGLLVGCGGGGGGGGGGAPAEPQNIRGKLLQLKFQSKEELR